MLIHQTVDENTIGYRYERQNWKEYLYFKFTPEFSHWVGSPILGYKVSKRWKNPATIQLMAVNKWFYPVFESLVFLKQSWWNIAKYFYRKGMLKGLREGEQSHWFWPRYFIK